ncbi:MAG: hypothetical protein RJB03_147 [Bacteroidota bacterium]|jgi:hypothetical protein
MKSLRLSLLLLFLVLFNLHNVVNGKTETTFNIADTIPSAPAAKTWYGKFGFKYTYVGQTVYQLGLDNQPNHRLKIENVYATKKTGVNIRHTGVNADSSVPALSGGGFAWFPNGGTINLKPGDTTVVQGWSSGWGECSCISAGVNNKLVRFVFSYDSTYYGPDGLPDGTITLYDTIYQPIKLLQRPASELQSISVLQTNALQQSIAGMFIIPGYLKNSVTLNNLSINTNEATILFHPSPTSGVRITDSLDNKYIFFNLKVNPRNDYRIQANFMSNNTSLFVPPANIVVPSNNSVNNLSAVALPYGKAKFTSDSIKVYETETGFWRTVFSPGDSSVTVFPGQENWYGNTTSEKNNRRALSKVMKFSVAMATYGNKLWEKAIPYESWGGGASKDGSVVAYMINQSGFEANLQNDPTVDWVGVLDGRTGAKLYGMRGNQSLMSGLEVSVSNRGQYIALGSTGNGQVSVFRNNGTSATLMWENAADSLLDINKFIGQVRKIVFSSDDQYLFVGSGDMYLRKYEVQTGKLLWKSYIGGWPFVNGISVANGYVAAGTKSRDRTLIRESNGEVIYHAGTLGFDTHMDSAFTGPVFGFGNLVTDASSGRPIAKVGGNAVKHSILNGDFAISGDRYLELYSRHGGNPLVQRTTALGTGSGENCQSGWVSPTGDRVVITGRDLTSSNTFPRKTVGFFKVNREINRYPTLDSVGSKSFNVGDSLRFKVTYRDFDDYNVPNTQLKLIASGDTSGLKVIVRGDSIIVYAVGFTGRNSITITVSETASVEKFSVTEKVFIRVLCSAPAIPTSNTTAISYCKGDAAAALTATAASGSSLVWYSVSTGGTGSSAAPIPSTISTGTQQYYAASIISGCESESRLAFAVTVNEGPSLTAIGGGSAVCLGSSLTLTHATSGGTWSTTTSSVATLSNAGLLTPVSAGSAVANYTVIANGCPSTVSATIAVSAVPAAPTVSTVSYCEGASAIALTATASSGNSLVWYGTSSTGGTASAVAPVPATNTAGSMDYYVLQKSGANCEGPRAKITVTVITKPAAPSVTALAYCLGGTSSPLTATALSGATLNWYGTNATGGSASSSAPTPSLAAVGTIDYYVSQTLAGCEGTRSKLSVTTKDVPAKPTISRDANGNLVSSATAGNQWYKDGALLSGSTGTTYKPDAVAQYTVKSTVNGCTSAASEQYYYILTAASNLSTNNLIRIYPNPASASIQIEYDPASMGLIQFEILDFSGKIITKRKTLRPGTHIFEKEFQGICTLKFYDQSGIPIQLTKLFRY